LRANGRAHARLVCEQFHPTRVGALTPVPTRNDRVGPDSTLSAPLRSQTRIHVLATRMPELCTRCCPSRRRGSRECRVRAAPAVSCASCTKKCAHEHTGSAEAIRHSLRNGFTAYAVLSPENRALLSPSPHGSRHVGPVGPSAPPQDLTPTAEASGPHDFAVRFNAVVLRAVYRSRVFARPAIPPARRRCRVHRIPSRVRDDRDTPLVPGKDGASW